MKHNILITGASSGLGKALSIEYAKSGHKVFGCGRRKDIYLEGADYQTVDLSKSNQVESWISNLLEKITYIDLCVNCAGSLHPRKKLWEFDIEESRTMIEMNVISVINLVNHVIPSMQKNDIGKFITMTSNPKGFPLSGLGLYAICKTSIERLIEVLGEELTSNITCVALYPGLVNTSMLQNSIGIENAKNYQAPEEWAHYASGALLKMDKKYHGLHVELDTILKTSSSEELNY